MIERQIKYGNHEVFLMKLYDERNIEINLLEFDFLNIKLKGKEYGKTLLDDYVIDKTGVVYTDTEGDIWLKFEFILEDYVTLKEGKKYICEIILERSGNSFTNLVEKQPNVSEHRFILKVIDTYIGVV